MQVINEDGSIATLESSYYYTRVKSSPEIEIIAPTRGSQDSGNDQGKDFSRRIWNQTWYSTSWEQGFCLSGVDIDDYTIDGDRNIVFQPGGDRTKVMDQYTIKITIPPASPSARRMSRW